MSRPDTWMPFYWRDFWADTAQLTPLEGWAYINLIGAYWTSGQPLPLDDERLQRLARVSAEEWATIKGTMVAFFRVESDDHRGYKLTHKRVKAELEKAVSIYEAQKARIARINSRTRHRARQSSKNGDSERASYTTSPTISPQQPQPHIAKAIAREDDLALDGPSSSREDNKKLSTSRIAGGAVDYVAPPPDAERNRWIARVSGFRKNKFWNPGQWGPPPGDPKCQVPKDIIADLDLEVPEFLRR